MFRIIKPYIKKMKNISILKLFLLVVLFSGCNNHDTKTIIDNPVESVFLIDSVWASTCNQYLDSLMQAVTVAEPDSNLAMLYYKIGEMYEDSDFEKAAEYYRKMGDLCEFLDWNQGRYYYTIGITLVLNRLGESDSAIAINLPALELAKKEKNELWIGRLYFSTANSYLIKQWYETALSYYLKALAIFEYLNEKDRLATVYFQLSQLHSDMGSVEKAITCGEKAIALCPDEPYFLAGLAKAYMYNYKLAKANKYFEKALHSFIQENNLYMMGWIYYHLGENSLMALELNQAEKYAREALKTNLEIGNMAAYSGALAVLGRVEKFKGNFTQAESYIMESMEIVDETDNLQGKSICLRTLIELTAAQNKYKENIKYQIEWELLDREISKQTSIQVAAEIEAKYETTKKELEITKQQQVIDSQHIQRNLLIGGIVLCVVFLVLLWYMLRLRIRNNNVLEELNATKDRFFSIISHDLKNPALAQRDAIRVLLDDKMSWDANTLNNYYQKMLKSAESHVDLLYNLLSWARVQTGRLHYQPVQFDFAAELRKNDFSLLRNMANRKEIDFSIEMPDAILVTGDANMLNTVVRNLLENAVKFTPMGGKVTLSVKPKENGQFVVSVSDTGIGMSEEQIKNLFHLDRQISKRGTSGEPGTGLGLIVSRELLEKHGSTLHIKSEEGKGSNFWFEI